MSEIVAFLPCRAGSERVRNKNTRPFAGVTGGLIEIKLLQLIDSREIGRVVVSTNDDEVMATVTRVASGARKPVEIDRRADRLCSSQTSTDELVNYASHLIQQGTMFWTHVTSPFVGAELYDKMVLAYRGASARQEYDSLMAVTPLRSFIWSEKGPVNYDRNVEKWPRTQTLKPLYEVNSAAFIAPVELMRRVGDRIGDRPMLYELDGDLALDIDWEDDFVLAEQRYRERMNR